jgi:hypothetical protein
MLPPLPEVAAPDPELPPESDEDTSCPLSTIEPVPSSLRLSPVAHAARASDAIHVTLRARRMCIHPIRTASVLA